MDWNKRVEDYLKTLTGGTGRQYRLALRDFETWYRQTYGAPPDPALLTGEELREWQSHLTGVRGLKAATVNQRLAGIARQVTSHTLRHTFATRIWSRRGSICIPTRPRCRP